MGPGARFCTLCLELPADLPEVDNWRMSLLWAMRCQDDGEVRFIQAKVAGYLATVISLSAYKHY